MRERTIFYNRDVDDEVALKTMNGATEPLALTNTDQLQSVPSNRLTKWKFTDHDILWGRAVATDDEFR